MPQILQFPVQLRFGDEDSYGHVNNVRFLQFLEDARLGFIHLPLRLDPSPDKPETTFNELIGTTHFTLVGRHEIEYLAPLNYRPEPVNVGIWVTSIGGSSFDFGYSIAEPDSSTTYALAASTMVMVDRATGRPSRLTDQQRSGLEQRLGEPVPFRARNGN